MAGEDAFEVEGRVMEVLPNGTYRVELANGHRLMAFVAGRAKKNFAGLNAGDKVKLQLSPYDLSDGRILVETRNDLENESSRISKKTLRKLQNRAAQRRHPCHLHEQAPQTTARLI